MASNAAPDQRAFCKSMFEALDVNGSGWLTRRDMESALPNMGIQATDEQLESIMNILDPDRDGKISFNDFFNGFVQLAGDSEAQDDVSESSISKSESNASNISTASAPEKTLSPPRPSGATHSPRSPGHKKNAMSMASPKVDERAAQAMNRMMKRATLSRGSSLSNLRKTAENNAVAMNAHRNKTAADDAGAHTRSSSKHSAPPSDAIDEDEEFNDVVGSLSTPPESPPGGGRNSLRSGRLGQSLGGGRSRGQTVAGDHDFAAHEFKHSKHRPKQSEDFHSSELSELERFLRVLDEPTSRDDERVDAKFQIREEFRRKVSSYDAIKEKLDKLNVSSRHLDSENARLTEEISKAAQRYRDLESNYEELQFRLQDARGDFSVAYGKVPTLEKEILELQQELENQKALLQIERKNKRTLQTEVENLNNQLKSANEKLRSRPSGSVPREPLEIVQKYKEAMERLSMLEEENLQLVAQLEQVEGDRAEQERIIQSLQEQGTTKIDSDSVLDELSQLRLKDQELARRFSTLEAQHNMATDQSKHQIERLEGQVTNLTKQLEDSKLALAGRDSKIDGLERNISSLQMQLAERDSHIEQLKKLHAERDKRKDDDLNDERKRHRDREDMLSREQTLLQQQLNEMREQFNLIGEQKERERQRADTIQAALQKTDSELQARLAKLASGVDEAVQVRLDDEEAREKLDKETSARVAAESRIRELEAEVARLRAEVKRLEEELARVNGDIDRIRADQRAREEAERLERERRDKEKREREEKERLDREAREKEEAEKKKAGIQMTDDNLDTLQAFARYFNGCLSGDRELKELGLFPIDATGTDFLTKLRDGVLLAKFINCAVPNTIDERALNRPSATTVMNSLKIVENLNLVLSAATSIGVGTKRIGISAVQLLDPTNQEHHRPILDFLWQLIYTKLTAPVSVRVHPELSRVIKEQGGKVSAPNPLVKRPSLHNFAAQSQKADTAEALALSPAELLNRWVNYHLKSFGLAANNLDKDLSTGKLYLALLTSIQYFDKTGGQMETPAPASHARSASSQLRSMLPTIDENDEKGEERANEVIERCADLGISTFGMVTAKHIAKGHSRFNLALVALIFASRPALPPITAQETQEMQKAGLLLDDGGDDREERAFRMWMNSSGLKKHINHLFVDCRDGIALLQMVEHVHPGLVNWKEVSIDPAHPLAKIGNLNQVIELAKKLRLSVVGIGGNDLYDMNRKLVLALVWQLMRHHIVQFIQQLHHKKFGNQPANDELIIKWANDRVAESGGLVSGSKTQMTGFNDKSLSSSLFFLDLLASVEPRVIDRSLVTPGLTAEEKLLNAGYTISVARKLGATIFLLPEDIVETKPKMIMTLVASIMAISTTDDVMKSEDGSSNSLETLAASVSAPDSLDSLDEDTVGPMVRSQTTNAFPVRQRSSSHIGVLSHTRQPSGSKLTSKEQN